MLKQRFPHLKVYTSIGGWTYSRLMHSFIHTAADRERMVKSCVAIVDKYSDVFDGVDLDLEYPCQPDDTACGDNITPSANDRDHFSLFMEEWRKWMPHRHITIATSAVDYKISVMDFARIDKLINSYNMMTYDFASGSWGMKFTGHQTNAYDNP